MDDAEFAELCNNMFRMKECDIVGVKTYSDPSHIFSGSQAPQPPGSTPIERETERESVCVCVCVTRHHVDCYCSPVVVYEFIDSKAAASIHV